MKPRGYTLVEMLLATALCSVLLAALWMLMSTYGELFDKGQQQVERAQLCRALLEQMADDLRCAIQDPLPGPTTDTTGAAQRRRFGLAGTSRELRFDVLQITPQQANPIPVGRTAGRTDETAAARVPELRTIHYTFFEPSGSEEPSEASPQGLVREELDFETPLDRSGTADREATGRPAAGRRGAETDADPLASQPDGMAEAGPAGDDTQLRIPEVASLQFRYFDGRGWSDAWNSLERKSLPAAVEIQLQLADSPPAARARRARAEMSGAEEGALPVAATDETLPVAESGQASAGSPRAGTTYRVVVDLPGSPSYRPPPVEQPPAVSQPVRQPVRRAAPPRGIRPAEPPPLPEDWIRTGSR